MCQHRLSRNVSDRRDAAHRGAALVAEPDEGAVDVEIEGLEAKTRGGGLAADRDKDLVGIECSLLAIRRFDLERPAFLLTF